VKTHQLYKVRGGLSKYVTKGNKTAEPLGSSTVQLHDSLGSRSACTCSVVISVVKMATLFEECANEEQYSLMRFLWAKGVTALYIPK
jgi:hypothetical protein